MLQKKRLIALLVVSAAWLGTLSPSQASNSKANLLHGVHWAGSAVTLEQFRGKTVVVVDWATWCPICNKWSPDFVKQLKETIEGKPVVVLAINTDERPDKIKQYLTERNFFAPNIIHGYDPAIIQRAELPKLWGYMIIDPTGNVVDKGWVNTFTTDKGVQKSVLIVALAKMTNLGEFGFIKPDMPKPLIDALWPIELGVSDSADARRKLSADQQKQYDAAIGKHLEQELTQIRELVKGDIRQQLEGHDRAVAFASRFKSNEQGKEARKLAASLESNAKFKRELSAKRAYEKCEKTLSAASTRRPAAMKALAKQFEGTIYGEEAKKEAGTDKKS